MRFWGFSGLKTSENQRKHFLPPLLCCQWKNIFPIVENPVGLVGEFLRNKPVYLSAMTR